MSLKTAIEDVKEEIEIAKDNILCGNICLASYPDNEPQKIEVKEFKDELKILETELKELEDTQARNLKRKEYNDMKRKPIKYNLHYYSPDIRPELDKMILSYVDAPHTGQDYTTYNLYEDIILLGIEKVKAKPDLFVNPGTDKPGGVKVIRILDRKLLQDLKLTGVKYFYKWQKWAVYELVLREGMKAFRKMPNL